MGTSQNKTKKWMNKHFMYWQALQIEKGLKKLKKSAPNNNVAVYCRYCTIFNWSPKISNIFS